MMPKMYMHPNGMVRGCYVYALLAQVEDSILVKVGLSADPFQRSVQIGNSTPFIPEILGIAEAYNRRHARSVEKDLHAKLASFKLRGEWFLLEQADKGYFHSSCREVFGKHSSPSKPIRWQFHSLDQYRAAQAAKQRTYLLSRNSRNKARSDFVKHQEIER